SLCAVVPAGEGSANPAASPRIFRFYCQGESMDKYVVYTRESCPYCVRAKQLLKSKGIAFEEINLEGREQELKELKERTGWRTVPQIFIDDKLIGGFQELAAMDARGELK